MKLSRLLGNFGTIRVGATAGIEFYWNNQWTVSCKMANATLTKTVKLSNDDLSAFYLKGNCEKGEISLKISQGNMEKEVDFSNGINKKVDMNGFSEGLIKMKLVVKKAKNMKVLIGWRNDQDKLDCVKQTL